MDYNIQEGLGHLSVVFFFFFYSFLFSFFLLKVKREVMERPELSGVVLHNCVAFVLALLECDCSLL